jgi:hypothetical protein
MLAEVSLPELPILAARLGQREVPVQLEQPWLLPELFSLLRLEAQPTGVAEARERQPKAAAWLGWHSEHRLAWKYAIDQSWF